MATQTINFGTRRSKTSSRFEFGNPSETRTAGKKIHADFLNPNTDAWLLNVFIWSTGRLIFRLAGSSDHASAPGPDFVSTFETSGQITFTAGSNSVTVIGTGTDTAEPYDWTPSNSSDVTTFFNTLTDSSSLSITLSDETGFGSLRWGSTEIKKIYWGATEIKKAYWGTTEL